MANTGLTLVPALPAKCIARTSKFWLTSKTRNPMLSVCACVCVCVYVLYMNTYTHAHTSELLLKF
uniref:Uncharacterized protein n=1 Tax=Anguilla anguilla TaxID=7936 RepID=A0A0E9SGC3_ANGAN